MVSGYLALVLHAHLPYVRHAEGKRVLEQNWYFQALTECYLPLMQVLAGLHRDQIGYRLTVSLSPTLLSMFADPLLQEGYLVYLDRLEALAVAEQERNRHQPEFLQLARVYARRLADARATFEHYGRNPAVAFRQFQEQGGVEVITTAATHGFLPLLRTGQGRRAQIRVGVDVYRQALGQNPVGFWLPECAYLPGLGALLRECGLGYFITETHGLLHARPCPLNGVYAPVLTPSRVAAFARDPESSRQVWDRLIGYPGDPCYREYYRDIGYDLDWEYLRDYAPTDIRSDTGFKYYRITGVGPEKQLYEPELAWERARRHAEHFLESRVLQAEHLGGTMDREPIIVAPYDAELFGHWWYEGPLWLDALFRRLARGDLPLRSVTPGDYLRQYPENEVVQVQSSTWGAGGYNEVWLNPATDWIYRHTHAMETRMMELADRHFGAPAGSMSDRLLNQAARELLLAQSSDWAFMIKMGTTVEYAERRLDGHITNFWALEAEVEREQPDTGLLGQLEFRNNLFGQLNFRVYSHHFRSRTANGAEHPLRALLLSWEFPPVTVGGLGRHVYDLSRALAARGDLVHVLTSPAPDLGEAMVVDGVRVHRLGTEVVSSPDFLEWVDQMNAGMLARVQELRAQGYCFDVVHAHDWLVGEAGERVADLLGVPLVATIHATEYGRHHGLHNDLQRRIHEREARLVERAAAVICCSRYMAAEVTWLFEVPPEKIRVIANGVEPAGFGVREWSEECAARGREREILFIGRLVPEKGIQVLLEALAILAPELPDLRLTVAGTGPYEAELREQVRRLGLNERVNFVGFVDGEQRCALFRRAAVAVFPSLYEPFGIVALEAMVTHVPVIVSDTGGLQDVIEHGVDGFRVPPDRPDMLAHYLQQVLTVPGLGLQLARRAWEKVTTLYDWRHIAGDTGEVYLESVAKLEIGQ